MNMNNPVLRGKQVRLWIAAKGLAPDCPFSLEACIIPDSVSWTQDVTRIIKKCPSRTSRTFETVATIDQYGDPEITTSIINRLPATARSLFLKLAKRRCPFDMIWAYGECSDPNNFHEGDKWEIFTNVVITDYDHDAVGGFDEQTLGDDVFENASLLIGDYYDLTRLEFYTRITEGNTPAGRFVSLASCHDCEGEFKQSTDCTEYIHIESIPLEEWHVHYSNTSGESTSVISDVTGTVGGLVYQDVDFLTVGNYILVGSESQNVADPNYYYAKLDDLRNGVATWIAVNDLAIASFNRFATDGEVIFMVSPGSNIGVLNVSDIGQPPVYPIVDGVVPPFLVFRDLAVSTDGTFYAMAYNDNDIYEYKNGVLSSWGPVPIGGGVGLRSIDSIDGGSVYVGASDGNIYFTRNRGVTWDITPVNISGNIFEIEFATPEVGYALVFDTIDNEYLLYFTANAGVEWVRANDTGAAGSASPLNSLSVCDSGNVIAYSFDGGIVFGRDYLRIQYGDL